LIFTIISSYSQQNYYVAIDGNNSNNGSINAEWRDIQYGISQLNPGDTLNIKTGTYSEKININVSGLQSAFITIRNYQNNEVIIDANNFNNSTPILQTDNAYIRIEGLHLTNNIKNYAVGFELNGAAHHIEFINNKISNIRFSSRPNATVTPSKNAVPLNIWADQAQDSIHNIIIKGNEVFNNQTGYSECITGGGNFSHFTIENNIVHDNTNIGIDITGNYGVCPTASLDQGRYGVIKNNIIYNCDASYSTSAGIYIDGGKNVIIENNISHHNGYGIEIGCEENGNSSNITVINNIIYQNSDAGIAIGGYDTNTTGNVINTIISGNTCYQNDAANNYNGEILLTKLDNCSLQNNIFYVSNQNVLLEASRTQLNFDFDYNLIFNENNNENITIETSNGSYNTLSAYYNASGQGAHNIFGNPMFVDMATSDFHISDSSPAIDNGNPNYTPIPNEIDIDQQVRVNSGTIDCGADEYYSPSSIITREINLKVYPNPTRDIIQIQSFCCLLRKYQIRNTYGQLLLSGNLQHNNTLDISILPKGIYILMLRDNKYQRIYQTKLIKK